MEKSIGWRPVWAALCVFNLLQYNILKVAFRHLDQFVLAAQFLWSGAGLIVIYRIRADYAIKQGIILMGSTIVMVIVMLIIRSSKDFGKWNWVFMLLAIALLGSTLILSRTIGGAKNWIDLGLSSFQPSEFAKILFIMGSAYFLSTKEGRLLLLFPISVLPVFVWYYWWQPKN